MAERIAVLGAGPMGLAVAYELVLQGHKPVIFEADDRVGGMTACFDFSGLNIERYYHFHCTSDVDFLQILDELGISDRMRWKETRMAYWYRGRLQPWGNPLALLRFKGISLVAKIRYGLFAFLCTKRKNWKPLDHVNARDWVQRWVGAEAYEALWRNLFEYKFHYYSDNLSAAWIWSRIRRLGRSRYNLMKEKLGFLEGGSNTLLQAMSAAITEAGGEIRLSCPAERVVLEDNIVKGVEVGGTLEPFDKVVSTIPLPFVPRLMPDLPEDLLAGYRSVRNIAVVCVIAKLARPLSDNFWININDPDIDIPGLVEYSNLQTLDHPIVYVPYYLPGDHDSYAEPDSWFIERVSRYLRTLNPELQPDDVLDIRASRYRFAQPICEPGFADRLPPIDLPIDGLWVADTSYYYPEDRGISESIGLGREIARQSVAC
ncbi:MAG: NAD(P)/FAD-dependent oxidoreductase [Halioglobus sp.]